MPIPLKAILYDPGAGGTPTTTNPRDLSGWAEEYSDSLVNEFGCESLRLSGIAASYEEVVDWTERLMSSIEVYTPTGRPRFFGYLHEVSIPALEVSLSLTDMANAVLVRYSDPDGVKGTATATSSASIARYGRKELIMNLSTALAADATNRGSTVLAQLAYPPNKETVSIERADGPIHVVLTFRGWAEALKWLSTTSATTATAVTSTQVTSLISTYNSTNAFFDTAGASVVASGFSATQYCDSDTPYLERIAQLLAYGNSSQQRVAWGFYTRAITIATAASAAPSTIAYYYSKRTRELRDSSGNVIPVWDWTPDVMIQNIDLLDGTPPSGALATLTRKYIRRVTLTIDKAGKVTGTLEPDDPDKLPEFLARPVSVSAGVSTRQVAIESRIVRTARIATISTDNDHCYNETTGVIRPATGGTGTVNVGTIAVGSGGINLGSGSITTGGGSITTGGGSISLGGGTVGNTGGANIDLGTGVGIGGSGSTGVTISGSGTIGALVKWATASALANAISGVDYAAASHSHAASDITSGTMATARLGSGSASSTTFLRGDQTWATPTAGAVGAAPDSATYIVQTASAGLSAEQALGALATGILKSTTTTGVISIAVSGTDYAAASHTHAAADIVSGTMATARLGSGTASSTTFLRGDQSWQAITTITPSTIGAAPDSATYIVQTASSGLSAEQALGALATGIVKNTTTTGVLSIAVSGTDYAAASHTHAASDIVSGTMATARLGSGTASSGTFLRGDQSWQALSTSDVSGSISGSGASTRAAYWSGTNTLTSSASFLFTGAGTIAVAGVDAGYAMTERDGAGQWAIYADAGTFRVWIGGDLVTINTSGQITCNADTIVLGGFTLNMDGNLRISGASASSGNALVYNGTAFVPTALTAANVSAAPDSATYIVQTASSGLSAEQALGALATGILKNTTTTGVLSIAVSGTDYAAASHTHAASDITSGTMATARLGSGTASSSTYLRGDQTWATISAVTGSGTTSRIVEWASSSTVQASTLIKSGAGVLNLNVGTTETLTIASGGTLTLGGFGLTLATHLTTAGSGTLTLSAASTYTLTIPQSGTAVVGNTGAAGRLTYWSGSNTVASNVAALFDPANGNAYFGGLVSGAAGLQTNGSPVWNLGAFTSGSDAVSTGYITVLLNGVTYHLSTRA